MAVHIEVVGERAQPEERAPHRDGVEAGLRGEVGGGGFGKGGEDVAGVTGGEVDGHTGDWLVRADAAEDVERADEMHTSEEQDEGGMFRCGIFTFICEDRTPYSVEIAVDGVTSGMVLLHTYWYVFVI